jgi:hypothetical protein
MLRSTVQIDAGGPAAPVHRHPFFTGEIGTVIQLVGRMMAALVTPGPKDCSPRRGGVTVAEVAAFGYLAPGVRMCRA